MSPPPVRFRLSEAARAEIENVRLAMAELSPDDPPAVFCLSWGFRQTPAGTDSHGSIYVAFVGRSQMEDVRPHIQIINGVPIVLASPQPYAQFFDGKVVDFSHDKWFHLKDG